MGEVVALGAVERQDSAPARVAVYASLRAAIVRAELAPGTKLSENELAGRLGVSRTPVREAVGRLRDDCLVEIVPQLGTFVSRIDARAVSDAQFVREAVECAAIRRAVELANEQDLTQLADNLEAQDRAHSAGNLETLYMLDGTFHRTICDLSGHGSVWAVSERVKAHLNRVRWLTLDGPQYLPQMIAEHRAVFEALVEHDADLAENALRNHLRMILREVPKVRARKPNYFDER